MKSMHTAGIRSIPKAQRSSYLDLFILSKEKDRLEKESFMVGKRNSSLDKQLAIINRRMEILKKEMFQEGKTRIHSFKTTRPLKKMSIHY
jgi:hypothetical protein